MTTVNDQRRLIRVDPSLGLDEDALSEMARDLDAFVIIAPEGTVEEIRDDQGTVEAMLHILALDPHATVQLSEFTGKWFVMAKINVGDGATLTSITEHRAMMADAVLSYLNQLKKVDVNNYDHYLVTDRDGERRHWRWNGATFVQTPLPVTSS